MEGLDYLCVCCKHLNCKRNKIQIKEINGCKTIKCLEFEKDTNKIKNMNYGVK